VNIYDTRRKNLSALIQSKYENNRSLFARSVDKNVNTINLYLTTNESLRRNIGERNARDLERMANLPNGWLDAIDSGAPGMSMVTGIDRISGSAKDSPDPAGDAIAIGTKFLRMNYPDVKEEDLGFITVIDDEMNPTLKRYDLAMVDKGDKNMWRAGLFLVLVGETIKVRRLSQKLDGGIEVSRDKTHFPDEVVAPNQLAKLKVIGRVIGSWEHRKL
jgi:hypothetical protein